jgi:sugar lactone lactonase YvrE
LADPASGSVQAVAVSPDGTTVAVATARGDLQLWRVQDGAQARVLRAETAATSLAFSADGSRLLALYSDGSVRLWDPTGGTMIRRLIANPRGTTAAALSPDGRLIAGGGADGEINLADAETGNSVRRFRPRAQDGPIGQPGPRAVRALLFAPDGSVLVTLHERFGGTHVWDPHAGREIDAPAIRHYDCMLLAFSPDGATLAVAPTMASSVTLVETATWRVRRKLDTRGFSEFLGGFSADGRSLWSASSNTLWRWDLATGRRARSFTGHRGDITAIAPFPRDLRVASAGDDGAAVVWDGAETAAIRRPAPAPDEVRVETMWAALAAEDAAAAYDALWGLVALPQQAVPYLRNRLPRQVPADPDKVRTLLAQLDDEQFAVRERATRELAQLGDAAEPLLREGMATTRSAEVAQRLQVLLGSAPPVSDDAEMLRALRSVEVFERIASPEARAALEELSTGISGSRLKGRATAALRRLEAQQRK